MKKYYKIGIRENCEVSRVATAQKLLNNWFGRFTVFTIPLCLQIGTPFVRCGN